MDFSIKRSMKEAADLHREHGQAIKHVLLASPFKHKKNKSFLLVSALLLLAISTNLLFSQNSSPVYATSGSSNISCDTQTATPTTQSGAISLPFNGFSSAEKPASATPASATPGTSTWTKTWGINSAQGSWGWNNMSTVCDPLVKGDAALKVHYAAHSSSPSCNCAQGGGQFYAFFKNSDKLSSLTTTKDVYLQYLVKFPKDFDFGKAAKLPGLFGGTGTGVSGGKHNTKAWSTRLMWRTSPEKKAQGEVYVYAPTRSSVYGQDLGLGKWTFQADDQWHSVQQAIQSSANRTTVTIWYDQQKVFTSPVMTTGVPAAGIFFSTFFGGHTSDWGPQKDEDLYFANFQVSNQYITSSIVNPTSTSATVTASATTSPTVGATASPSPTPSPTPNSTPSPTATPSPTPNSTPTPSPTPNSTPTPSPAVSASPTTSPQTGESVTVNLQAYAYPDNTDGAQATSNTAVIAYPKNAGFPTLHDQATEGAGTIDDPITFAAYTPLTQEGDQAVFPPGTKIYVESLRKYFILEDTCDDCDKGPAGTSYAVRLWLGPSSLASNNEAQSIEECVKKVAQTTASIVLNPSSDYPVEKTPLYSGGACTAKIFTDKVPNPGGDTTPTVQPTGQPTEQLTETPTVQSTQTQTVQPTGGPSTDGKTINVAVTSFGFPDNDDGSGHFGTTVIAFPKSDDYPTIHNEATEGTGAYDDPITFAAYVGDTVGNNPAFPPGTRIYVPSLHKYFILEDQCAGCNDVKGGNAFHIDLWLGPGKLGAKDTAQSIEACEGTITRDTESIIMSPTSTHPVDTTPLYKDGACSAKQYSQ